MTFSHRGWDPHSGGAADWLDQRPQPAGAALSAVGAALGLAAWREAFGVVQIGIEANLASGMDADASRPAFDRRLRLQLAGETSVAGSHRDLQDELQDRDSPREARPRRPMESLDHIPGPARGDESFPGDIPTDGETPELVEGISGVHHGARRPHLRRDVDRILSTLLFDRDDFPTWERGLIYKSELLAAGGEAGLVTPWRFLHALDAARAAGREGAGRRAEELDGFVVRQREIP